MRHVTLGFLLVLLFAALAFACGKDAANEPTADKVETGKEIAIPAPPPGALSQTVSGPVRTLEWENWLGGDSNNDKAVNGQDVFLLAARFGQESNFNGHTATTDGNDCVDGNRDGLLTGLDLFSISVNFMKRLDGWNAWQGAAESGPYDAPLNIEPIAPQSAGCGTLESWEYPFADWSSSWCVVRAWDDIAKEEGSDSAALPPPAQPYLESIRVEPADATLHVDDTRQYTATGVFSDLTEQDMTALCEWLTNPEATASIGETGNLTALEEGSCQVSAAFKGLVGQTGLTVEASGSIIWDWGGGIVGQGTTAGIGYDSEGNGTVGWTDTGGNIHHGIYDLELDSWTFPTVGHTAVGLSFYQDWSNPPVMAGFDETDDGFYVYEYVDQAWVRTRLQDWNGPEAECVAAKGWNAGKPTALLYERDTGLINWYKEEGVWYSQVVDDGDGGERDTGHRPTAIFNGYNFLLTAVWCDETNGDLWFGMADSSDDWGWNTSLIASEGNFGGYQDIGFMVTYPFSLVVARDDDSGHLMLGDNSTFEFVFETVDDSGTAGYGCSMFRGHNGHRFLSHFDHADNSWKMTVDDGGEWQTSTLATWDEQPTGRTYTFGYVWSHVCTSAADPDGNVYALYAPNPFFGG